ncbi:hypothetical protein SFRURICE_009245 [Spodoptera frugiperda]|nr:hypothetical protein SFRURICE_009245 [Spodoptera frugiperda]
MMPLYNVQVHPLFTVCYKSHVIRGEPIAIYWVPFLTPCYLKRNFRKMHSNALLDLGIEPDTSRTCDHSTNETLLFKYITVLSQSIFQTTLKAAIDFKSLQVLTQFNLIGSRRRARRLAVETGKWESWHKAGFAIIRCAVKTLCPTLGFSPVSWVRLQTYKPHTHDTQTRNNNLWITQRVAPCGIRTRYPLRGSQLPSHRTNRAVKSKSVFTSAQLFVPTNMIGGSQTPSQQRNIAHLWWKTTVIDILHVARLDTLDTPICSNMSAASISCNSLVNKHSFALQMALRHACYTPSGAADYLAGLPELWLEKQE